MLPAGNDASLPLHSKRQKDQHPITGATDGWGQPPLPGFWSGRIAACPETCQLKHFSFACKDKAVPSKLCHPERSVTESKDLRDWYTRSHRCDTPHRPAPCCPGSGRTTKAGVVPTRGGPSTAPRGLAPLRMTEVGHAAHPYGQTRNAVIASYARDVFAALAISAKSRGSRLAPPTSAPSMSGSASSTAALEGFTLPPYWMRMRSATSALAISAICRRNERVRFLRLVRRGVTPRADGPDGFVSDDRFLDFLGVQSC